jgi:hypothetical protein
MEQVEMVTPSGLPGSQSVPEDYKSLDSETKLQNQALPKFLNKNPMLHVLQVPSSSLQKVMKQYIEDMK